MNAAQWNTLYPIGTDVFLIEGGFTGEDVEEVHTRTVSAAWDPLHCDTLVELDGVEGPRLLNRVRPLTPKPKHLLQQPFGLLEKMRLSEALDMMASHGVAKVASVFSSQDDEPVFAVVMLTGDRIQDYLDTFEEIDDEKRWLEVFTQRITEELESVLAGYAIGHDKSDHSQTSHSAGFVAGFRNCLGRLKEKVAQTVAGPGAHS